MIYDWPPTLLQYGVGFNQRGMTLAGPLSLTGRSQTAAADAGYWIATFGKVWTMEKASVLTFRAMRALLEGGTNQVRVPVMDFAQQPWVLDSSGNPITTVSSIPHDDLAFFDDLSGYADYPLYVKASAAAAVGATLITADFHLAGTLYGGEYFSIGDRLYVVRSIMSEAIVSSPSPTRTRRSLYIWPRLREALASGTELNFHAPVCRMRLANDGEMDLNLEMGKYASPDVQFIEVF